MLKLGKTYCFSVCHPEVARGANIQWNDHKVAVGDSNRAREF